MGRKKGSRNKNPEIEDATLGGVAEASGHVENNDLPGGSRYKVKDKFFINVPELNIFVNSNRIHIKKGQILSSEEALAFGIKPKEFYLELIDGEG